MNGWGKIIYCEFFKSLKFDHTDKWYMPKAEFTLDNEMHQNLWDFEIKMDHPLYARRPEKQNYQGILS